MFKAVEPVVTASKTWRMVEFGGGTIGGWVWTGSLVIRRRDLLDPMMKGVSPDGGESVGSVRIDLARQSSLLLPETERPARETPGRPCHDGSLHTTERLVSDLAGMFRHMKALIRHGWSNQDAVRMDIRHEPAR